MRVLWVSAHPEPRSLTSSLRLASITTLTQVGHTVEESDLYAMEWDPVVRANDFTAHDPKDRLVVGPASGKAFWSGTVNQDIKTEHDKLDQADLIVLQFPLWWYGLPAILKGWIERTFVMGFGYPINDPAKPRDNARYGEGRLAGKRAMLVVTSGSNEESLGPRGIHGPIDELLFPIQHGVLFYAGAQVLPPFVTFLADWLTDETYQLVEQQLTERLTHIEHESPIPYRSQRGGDYTPTLTLRPDLMRDEHGSRIHAQAVTERTQ